jgi:hypothetical protein
MAGAEPFQHQFDVALAEGKTAFAAAQLAG